MKLKSTDTLEVLLAGAVTTNQCPLIAAFADVATDSTACAPSSTDGQTNSTTAVTWVASPSTGFVRQIAYLSFYNADTASVTVTVRINNGSTTRILRKFMLLTGESFAFKDGNGFSVYDASGTPKSSAGLVNPMTTSQDIIVGGAAGAAGRLGVGSTGQALVVNASGNLAYAGGEGIAEPVNALTISSGVVNIDCALGDYFTLSLSANVTSITFSNLPPANKAQTIMVRIQQNASAAKTVAFPSSFKWAGGTTGVVSATLSAYDNLALSTFDQGTRWEATLSKAHS